MAANPNPATSVLRVIPIFKRGAQREQYTAAPKRSLTPLQQRQAAKFLHGILESGWEDSFFFNLVRTSHGGWTVRNFCPLCGVKPPEHIKSPSYRRVFMMTHMASHLNGR